MRKGEKNVQQTHKVFIVGVGDDGLASLTESARRCIEETEVILGSARALELLPSIKAERVVMGANLDEMVRRVERDLGKRRLVVLASGDPLFYGVARFLCDRLGKESFEVVPHVSTMQLAFARVKESWDEAYLTDLALHPFSEVIDRVRVAEKVGLFTHDTAPPATVARALLDEGIDYFRVYVCENLGTRNEVITQGTLREIAEMPFGPLNVMVLVRQPEAPDQQQRAGRRGLLGNPDELFLQSRPKRGLLTPAEIRPLALALLHLRRESVVWDVGAGSGSVSVEAGQLAPAGRVFAIEPDMTDCQLIRDNAQTFSVPNVEVVHGRAPGVFAQLPAPDSIFMGGLGRETVGILAQAFECLKPGGALVANVASLENVSLATAILKKQGRDVGVLMANLARGVHQLDTIRFEALNPSFLISARKP